jgi:hypothetical protein
MLRNFVGNILAITKGLFAGQVVDNRLNPILLAIATAWYRIQSCTLHIPDRIGFFSSSPPRLQVHQAACFIVLVFASCFSVISGGFILFLARLCGQPISLKLCAAMLSMTLAQAVSIWVLMCCDRHRAPGYEWDDWKLRKD